MKNHLKTAMKTKILILFLLVNYLGFSQKHNIDSNSTKRVYMPLKFYKEKHKKPLTKKDSLTFKYRDGDTLVLVENFFSPKGVKVPYEFKDSTFLKYYKKVAFNHKGDSISKKTSMKYWKDDIRVFFSESVSKKVKKELMSFAKEIDTKVDSLKISEVKRVEESNFIIYYFGDYEYESAMSNYKKTSNYSYWKENKIYKAAIKLDSDLYFNYKLQIYELKKHLFQTLGYFKFDDNLVCEDYFSGCYSDTKKLSTLDIELLKYHYSYGICKGTDLETFELNHAKAKEVLKEHNTLMYFLHQE